MDHVTCENLLNLLLDEITHHFAKVTICSPKGLFNESAHMIDLGE